MSVPPIEISRLMTKLRQSRTRLLLRQPFFGLLLANASLGLDDGCETAYTNGKNIRFSPQFLAGLTPRETDFVLCHEILHIVLGHCFRAKGFEPQRFNVACDIVVNDLILEENGRDLSSISIKGEVMMHETPKGARGYKFTAEQVYAMLPVTESRGGKGNSSTKEKGKKGTGQFDDHSPWEEADQELYEEWAARVKEAVEACEKMGKGRGASPLLKEFLIGQPEEAKLDWREILSAFVQEEVTDYTLVPPDRRYQGDFFLPDFAETTDSVKDILFMVDTSGSMSDKEIRAVYSEIVGAISQFGGRLKGFLGFFDAAVVPPKPFEDVDDLKSKRAFGRGGTSFDAIFDYVDGKMEHKPASIVILTDGYAPWPQKAKAKGIPVLWIINNEKQTPPWGKVIRLPGEDGL
jgi:predicted metal-dependent peptidase